MFCDTNFVLCLSLPYSFVPSCFFNSDGYLALINGATVPKNINPSYSQKLFVPAANQNIFLSLLFLQRHLLIKMWTIRTSVSFFTVFLSQPVIYYITYFLPFSTHTERSVSILCSAFFAQFKVASREPPLHYSATDSALFCCEP